MEESTTKPFATLKTKTACGKSAIDEIRGKIRVMTYYGVNKPIYQLADKEKYKGGEGKIYAVQSHSNLLAKIYINPSKYPELKEKLYFMMKNPPKQDILDQIAWPLDILMDAGGSFVGFVMSELLINAELKDVYKYPLDENLKLTNKQKIIIAINICRVISEVHNLGYVFGDFNPKNVGVNLKNGNVAFLDTDSYHITNQSKSITYRCKVCMDGYVAPELIQKTKGTDFANAPLPTFTKETDYFALAIHIFKLLMNGFTPYNGIPKHKSISTANPGLGNNAIANDSYCFKAGNKPMGNAAVLPLSAFPNDIQILFTRAFDEGHQNPSIRPSAKEWEGALTSYYNSLKNCVENPIHYYDNSLITCPYCEADEKFKSFLWSLGKPFNYSANSNNYKKTATNKSVYSATTSPTTVGVSAIANGPNISKSSTKKWFPVLYLMVSMASMIGCCILGVSIISTLITNIVELVIFFILFNSAFRLSNHGEEYHVVVVIALVVISIVLTILSIVYIEDIMPCFREIRSMISSGQVSTEYYDGVLREVRASMIISMVVLTISMLLWVLAGNNNIPSVTSPLAMIGAIAIFVYILNFNCVSQIAGDSMLSTYSPSSFLFTLLGSVLLSIPSFIYLLVVFIIGNIVSGI